MRIKTFSPITMKLSITILGLLLAISFAKCDENQASSAEAAKAVVKSSVTQKAKDEKAKIDAETKEQLEETTNDDKELQKQQKEQDNKASSDTEEYAENASQETDDGSADESSEDEGEKDSDDAAESDDSTIKRAEEGKDSKGKSGKKGKKIFGYPLFYPGDYFGGMHSSELGGPAGFHPGSIWEYPYPFVHPMYPSPYYPCSCKCKDDKEKEKSKKEDKKSRRKQLVPSHYYGPPSAGWGAYQPGHTGAGWGAPYWYKSYIPSSSQAQYEELKTAEPRTEEAETRHTIHDGLDFGVAHGHEAADISYGYGHADEALDSGDQFGAGWHDGYTDHPVYGAYGSASGRSAYVDPVYGDLENTQLNGWGHGVGHAYVPHNDIGVGHAYGGQGYGGHGYGGHGDGGHDFGRHGYSGHGFAGHLDQAYAGHVGHPYIPSHAGINSHAVHTDEQYFGPHTATMPTAQGHIQVASAGHAVGLGGHNLGGMADKVNPVHGTQGDFVGGIHADLGSHEVHGHHHDHASAGHLNEPSLHGGSAHAVGLHGDGLHGDGIGFHGDGLGDGLAGDLGDHFGGIQEHHEPRIDVGMGDHFGPIMEHMGHGGDHSGGHAGYAGHAGFAGHAGYAGHGGLTGHAGYAGHGGLSGHAGFAGHGGHGVNHRIFHDFGGHAGHGGAFDGHIGDSVSASHLFGGVHKSGVPVKHKAGKKNKAHKGKVRGLKRKGRHSKKVENANSEQLP